MIAEFSLDGRVAVVTGAAGLLGREHAKALSLACAQVVLTDLNVDALERAAHEVTLAGGPPPLAIAADVTDPESLEALRDRAIARFGRVDVLVNNAAMNDRVEAPSMDAESARFERYPLAEWRRMMDVNVTGVFLPRRSSAARWRRAGAGAS